MADPLGSIIPGLDPLTGTMALPLWAVGGVTALFVALAALAFIRAGYDGIVGGVARFSLVLVGAVLAWFALEGTTRQDSAAERRALEARASVLATRATMPGSPLACLDAMAGDAVERSCERTLFATPEAMASAVSYVAAQLSLFADVNEFVARGHGDLEPLLAGLRRAVESDRFGLVAHVLATRDGCTVDQCQPLVMMRDASKLTANLKQGTYDLYVGRYSAVWPAPAGGPVASAAAPPSGLPGTAGAQPSLQGTSAVALPGAPRANNGDLFFPSSESIPPVNIMTAEPGGGQGETTGSAPAPARTPARRPAQKEQAPKQPPPPINAAGAPRATAQ